MSVDSFDEALALLEGMGFTDRRPSGTVTDHSKSTMLLSPEGYMVHITEHIKK